MALSTTAQYVLSPLKINWMLIDTNVFFGPFFMLTQWVVFSLIFLNGFLVALNEDYSKQMDALIKKYGRKTIDLLSSMKLLLASSLGFGYMTEEDKPDVVRVVDRADMEKDDNFLLRMHVT